MHPLLEMLITWKGRSYVQNAIEERGFMVPRAYQKFVKDYCGQECTEDIETYWDEWAKELMSSGGRCNPNLRQFRGECGYRSEYLDNLASTFNYKTAIVPNPPIHPCLYELMKRQRIDPSFGLNITARLEDEKATEIQALNISGEGFSDPMLKKEVKPIFEKYIEACGFRKIDKKFAKRTDSGLIFHCSVDVVGGMYLVGLPLYFFISHESDEDWVFQIDFNTLVPGFFDYTTHKTPASAILGIYAFTQMFDVLTTSFH